MGLGQLFFCCFLLRLNCSALHMFTWFWSTWKNMPSHSTITYESCISNILYCWVILVLNYLKNVWFSGAQISAPLVFLFVPVAADVICYYLLIQASRTVIELAIGGIVVYGFFNCSITVFLITPYRNHFYNTFVPSFLKKKIVTNIMVGGTIVASHHVNTRI